MAEVEGPEGPVGGIAVPTADALQIEAQNAARLANRRQAAALAFQVEQVEAADLSRFGDTRQVGGTFERLQEVPEAEVPGPQGIDLEDILNLLGLLSFGGKTIPIGGEFIPPGG